MEISYFSNTDSENLQWSMFFSLGIIMTAFDPQLLGSLYATPAFQKDFGYLFEGEYIISAPWQTGLGMGSRLIFTKFLVLV